jgi:hypothetical protein
MTADFSSPDADFAAIYASQGGAVPSDLSSQQGVLARLSAMGIDPLTLVGMSDVQLMELARRILSWQAPVTPANVPPTGQLGPLPYAPPPGTGLPDTGAPVSQANPLEDTMGTDQTARMIDFYSQSVAAVQEVLATNPDVPWVDVGGTKWSTDPGSIQNMQSTLASLEKTQEINSQIAAGQVPTDPNRQGPVGYVPPATAQPVATTQPVAVSAPVAPAPVAGAAPAPATNPFPSGSIDSVLWYHANGYSQVNGQWVKSPATSAAPAPAASVTPSSTGSTAPVAAAPVAQPSGTVVMSTGISAGQPGYVTGTYLTPEQQRAERHG